MTELDTDYPHMISDAHVTGEVEDVRAAEASDMHLPEGVEAAADIGGVALKSADLTDAGFGELVERIEPCNEGRRGASNELGAQVMVRTADVAETHGHTSLQVDDKDGTPHQADEEQVAGNNTQESDSRTLRTGDHMDDGDPPRDGDGSPEASDEEDKRAELARRYAEKFAPKVQALRDELGEEIFTDPPMHPGFVAYDHTDTWVGLFQIGDTDDPDRKYAVRIPLDMADTRANSAIEERRLDAFLKGDSLQEETKDSMVQIVAYDPESHLSVTEAPGIPIHEVPRSMWTAISRPETLEQLRNATLDMARNGITVQANQPIIFWNQERQRLVLGNYVPGIETDDEQTESALARGLEGFRSEAQVIAQMCPRPEAARLIRAHTTELYDELADDPMYLRPLESNMPELEVVRAGRDGPRVPLGETVQDEVLQRTLHAEEVPGFPAITDDERLLLNGLAHGLGQQKIADQAGRTRDDMADAAREVKDWLGMPDQPSSLYRALLHHSIDILPPEIHVERPILTTNESVHFYLASIGFSKREAAHMVGVAEGTVKRHRDSVLAKFGATSMSQAVAHAFSCRYYKSFPPPETDE